MRKIILIGAFVGLSASVPIVYQASPETFHRLVAPAPEAEFPMVASFDAKAAVAETQSPLGRKVRIDADGSGHFRTDIRFNGRKINGLIDTGATVVAINNSTARRIGIIVPAADFRHEVNTANGKTLAALIKVDSIEIGRIRIDDVDAVVLDDKSLRNTLIGMNVLKRLRKVEVQNDVLVLEQ